MTAINSICRFVDSTGLSDIPDDVIARGRMILADCVGCMVAGGQTSEVRQLVALERVKNNATEATALGTGEKLARGAAAFINGTAGTWHDLDEGNLSTKTHAAIQLVPAAVAEAEANGQSGRELLEATILAYEASARLWRATTARLAVHPHGTYGPLAATLAVGKLRGMNPVGLANAAGIALTMGLAASRATLNDGATIRNIYTGISGRHGFEALALDQIGFSAEADAATSILGSIYGSNFDADAVTSDLGQTWWIRRNYFKRFASGRYTHGALDLVEDAQKKSGQKFTAKGIKRVDVETYFFAATLGQQSARTPFGVRFSIPLLMASHIIRGVAPLTDDCSAILSDPDVADLAKRIFVTESADATAAYPDHQPTHMVVTYRDGSSEKFSSEITLGEADNPLPDEALKQKFIELTHPAWQANAETAWCDLMNIDHGANIDPMMRNWHCANDTE
jgi:2-methylcitrate dehydratase PrpD